MNLIKICVWTCDMASRSYFGKMNSTLGSVVPLAMFYSSACQRLFCYDIIVQVIMGEPIAASLGTDGVFCFSPINHVPGPPVKETHVLIRNPLLQPLLATRCCSCPLPSSQVFKEWWAYLCFNMDIVAFITWSEWHLKIFREDQDTPRYLMELLSNGSLQVGNRDYFKCLDLSFHNINQ